MADNRINFEDWLNNDLWKKLVEQGAYATGTDTGPGTMGSAQMDPYNPTGPNAPAQSPSGDPNIANMPPEEMGGQHEEEPDYSADPKYPDMPEDRKHLDYEQWRKEFMDSAIKGDVQEMKELLSDVRDRHLDCHQRTFVDDNYQIVQFREFSNVAKTGKEIKKLIKEDLDHNNPGTSVASHIVEVLQTDPLLNNVYIKLSGLHRVKGDYHRKFIAAITGSVQVGGGAAQEDLIYNEKDFSIRMSTRFFTRFGDIYIGNWSLRSDDPQRYLKAPELQRLEDGAPEEKDALRKRIISDSIAETFKTRAFIINVAETDGTVYTIGWDLATALKAGYTSGHLVVKTESGDGSEAMIDEDGTIVNLVDIKVMFVKHGGELDDNGKPHKREHEFIVRKNGQLFLNATLQTLKQASASFPGMVIRETPYTGNPSDLKVLQRCVPTVADVLMRQCS